MAKKDQSKKEKAIIRRIRENARRERVSREKEGREGEGLLGLIKRKWQEFGEERRLAREIKEREKRHERERFKKIKPDEGFGD